MDESANTENSPEKICKLRPAYFIVRYLAILCAQTLYVSKNDGPDPLLPQAFS